MAPVETRAVVLLEHEDEEGRQRASSGYIKVLAERWHAMTPAEREVATRSAVGDLTARRESRQRGIHNVSLEAFNDANRTLSAIQREVRNLSTYHNTRRLILLQLENLYERTGFELALLAVRASVDQYMSPYFFYTSDRLGQYFELLTKGSVADFAYRVEGWCVAGVDGEYSVSYCSSLMIQLMTSHSIHWEVETAAH